MLRRWFSALGAVVGTAKDSMTEVGQTTAEYALVILGAAAIGTLVITWVNATVPWALRATGLVRCDQSVPQVSVVGSHGSGRVLRRLPSSRAGHAYGRRARVHAGGVCSWDRRSLPPADWRRWR